jgi:hypothetical protein
VSGVHNNDVSIVINGRQPSKHTVERPSPRVSVPLSTQQGNTHLDEVADRTDRLHARLRRVVAAGAAQVLQVLHVNGTLQVEAHEVQQVAHGRGAHLLVEVLCAVQEDGVEHGGGQLGEGLQVLLCGTSYK